MKILRRGLSWTLERFVAPVLGLHEMQLPPSSVQKKVYFYIYPVGDNKKIKGTLFAPVTIEASNYSNILRKLITKDYVREEDLEIYSGLIKCFNDNSGIEYLLVPKNKCVTNNTYKNNSVFILIANSSEDLNILDKYITDINIKNINFCLVLIISNDLSATPKWWEFQQKYNNKISQFYTKSFTSVEIQNELDEKFIGNLFPLSAKTVLNDTNIHTGPVPQLKSARNSM